VFFQNIRERTKSRNSIILSVIHCWQNPSELASVKEDNNFEISLKNIFYFHALPGQNYNGDAVISHFK
jgi:hypothetical protein